MFSRVYLGCSFREEFRESRGSSEDFLVQFDPWEHLESTTGARPSSGAASPESEGAEGIFQRAGVDGCCCARGRARSAQAAQYGGIIKMHSLILSAPFFGFSIAIETAMLREWRCWRGFLAKPSRPASGRRMGVASL